MRAHFGVAARALPSDAREPASEDCRPTAAGSIDQVSHLGALLGGKARGATDAAEPPLTYYAGPGTPPKRQPILHHNPPLTHQERLFRAVRVGISKLPLPRLLNEQKKK